VRERAGNGQTKPTRTKKQAGKQPQARRPQARNANKERAEPEARGTRDNCGRTAKRIEGAKSSKKTTRGGARGEGAGAEAVPPRESRDYGVGATEPRLWGRVPRSAATATE